MSDKAADLGSIAHRERTDALGWLFFACGGLMISALAVHLDARLGTASAPFLGRYDLRLGPATLLAPAVASGVILITLRGAFAHLPWHIVQILAYGSALSWALALALVDGWSGLTKALGAPESYLGDVHQIGDHPFEYIKTFTSDPASHSDAARGHPPGPVLVLWLLGKVGIESHVALGILITALATLTVPLVLTAVRDACGEIVARRFAPVLVLAPYAVWVAVSLDAVVATVGAAAIVAGARASRQREKSWHSPLWALLAGVLIGLAALFSYASPWLGISIVFIYFARRRPFLNLASGAGALVPVLVASQLGFNWTAGLKVAAEDFNTRVEPYRSVLWWSVISIVALLLAAGPPLYASLRKMRNTPAWPFLVGAGAAVIFSIVAGLARGGVEHAWLPFFPWLTVAAVAPERQAGPPVQTPLWLVALGAFAAIVIEAFVATPW
jgi:methylthioxylose transferase